MKWIRTSTLSIKNSLSVSACPPSTRQGVILVLPYSGWSIVFTPKIDGSAPNPKGIDIRSRHIDETIPRAWSTPTTKGTSWGYPVDVLRAVRTFFSTFGENRPRFLKNLSKSTFEYPHEGPCVAEPWALNPNVYWSCVPAL